MNKNAPICYLSSVHYESDKEELHVCFDTKGIIISNRTYHHESNRKESESAIYDCENIHDFCNIEHHLSFSEDLHLTYNVVYKDFIFSFTIVNSSIISAAFKLVECIYDYHYSHASERNPFEGDDVTILDALKDYTLPEFYVYDQMEETGEEFFYDSGDSFIYNNPHSTPMVYLGGYPIIKYFNDERYDLMLHSPLIFKYDHDLNRVYYRTVEFISGPQKEYFKGVRFFIDGEDEPDFEYEEMKYQRMSEWKYVDVTVTDLENDKDFKKFMNKDENNPYLGIKTFSDVRCYDVFAKQCGFSLIMPRYFVFDVETTGTFETQATPRIVQLAWALFESDGSLIEDNSFVIRPDNFDIPKEAAAIHGITRDIAEEEGISLFEALQFFINSLDRAEFVVGHNLEFDVNVLKGECNLLDNKSVHAKELEYLTEKFSGLEQFCTMKIGSEYCEIEGSNGYKWPKLSELYFKLFNSDFSNAHNALYDVKATAKCFFELKRRRIIEPWK